jgi:hypothetical protein
VFRVAAGNGRSRIDSRQRFVVRAGAICEVSADPAQKRVIAVAGNIFATQTRRIMHADDATTALHHQFEISKLLLSIFKAIGWEGVADKYDGRGRLTKLLAGPLVDNVCHHDRHVGHSL